MDSIMDASSWPALSSPGVSSPEVIFPTTSMAEIETCNSVPTKMTAADESSSLTVDSTVSIAVSVDDSAPRSDHTTVMSSSTPSSMGPRPIKNQSSSQYNYGHNQNHHHYPSNRLGQNQRGNGFNWKGGKRGGDGGLRNQNFSNRRHQQQRGFNNWNRNRGGLNSNTNANAHARWVNSDQHTHHGFESSGYLGQPPPLTHSFLHSPLPYVNINVNHPPPPPAPIPSYMLSIWYYNAYFSDASNPLYYPPLPPATPLPPVPSLPPYVDPMSGVQTYNQPILPNSELELCSRILHQIEYYFSKENLIKDAYMKSLMDNEGWVPVHLIAGFRRVKAMTSDINLIVRALESSAVVEVQGDKMRNRRDWMNWVQNRSLDARISSVTDISTGIQNINLREEAGADALIVDDPNRLHAKMTGSGAS
ncbi:la-related protein 1C-like [Telopea speciosissima]|uniref:la-related protein 1C-like n=1 Tax=Telopea speciosissima TaxID=54955 RepID=UPI001CC7F32B|nr:la-related protein 1C-like [Telopea speciosissima]